MRIQIIILQLMIWTSLSVFGQDTLSQDSKNIQYKSELDKEIGIMNSINFEQSDTAYYKSGEIKSISFYPKTKNNIGSGLVSNFVLQKKVFQYDKCGNLRNITEISRYIGRIESCHDYYFNNPYQIKDNIIENVECDELWIKPLVY